MCLGYLGRMSADYAKIRLAVPADIPLMQMAPRPYEVTPRFKEQPMARTTNVEKALALMKKPEGADFIIRIEDDFLPENSGVYHVTAGNVEKTEAEADLSLDQRTFTLLALGALSLDEAAYRSDVKISANRAMLSRVFVKKPLFIADYF
jgi:predicted acetyltransferase